MRTEWTEFETRYMEKKYVNQPVEKTAKRLNRTVASVKRKAAKMGLNHYIDVFSAKTLSHCFNVDMCVVRRWINKFDLPHKAIQFGGQTRYIIDIDKFWKWAEEHKEIINWSKYEPMSICPEPDWLKNAIRDYSTPKARKKFTEQEITMIKGLLYKGLGYKEIATQTGRSYYSILHLCRKIFI